MFFSRQQQQQKQLINWEMDRKLCLALSLWRCLAAEDVVFATAAVSAVAVSSALATAPKS